MGKVTPSMAKNYIRRALTAIIDPFPTNKQIEAIWEYFKNRCAYCGCSLEKAKREGHLDHCCPSSKFGSNEFRNFVLACGRCNGDEKRERDWDGFLREKCGDDDAAYQSRRQAIVGWIGEIEAAPSCGVKQHEVERIVSGCIESFDAAVDELRRLKDTASS